MSYISNYGHERRVPKRAAVRAAALPRADYSRFLDTDAYLRSRGLPPFLARYNGWYPSVSAGDSALRLVIPAIPESLRYWQARAVVGAVTPRYQSPSGHFPGTLIQVSPVPGHAARRPVVVIVEGPFCALSAAACGYLAFAEMGNAQPLDRLVSLATCLNKNTSPTVVVLSDADTPGGLERTFTYLSGLGVRACYAVAPSPYKDLAEMPLRTRREFLRGLLS